MPVLLGKGTCWKRMLRKSHIKIAWKAALMRLTWNSGGSGSSGNFVYAFKLRHIHTCINAPGGVFLVYLKTTHIFKSCNIYLKPERFRKSKVYIIKGKLENL